MKKLLFIGLGLFLYAGSTFALTDCSVTAQGGYSCGEYQVCNNPGGSCVCMGKFIANNSLCYANRGGKIINIQEASAYMTSGSQVVFYFILNNTTSSDKTFTLNLNPSFTSNPKIKITAFDPNGIENPGQMSSTNGLFSPRYTLSSGVQRTLIITGEAVSTAFGFERFDAEAKITRNGFLSRFYSSVEVFPISIYPIGDLTLTQKIDGPFPVTSGAEVTYLFTLKNSGSATANGPVVKDIFPLSFLILPSLVVGSGVTPYQPLFTSPNIYTRNTLFSPLQPGEEKTFLIKSTIGHDLLVGDTIVNTGIIEGVRELSLDNNVTALSYTVPPIVDLIIESVTKTTSNPTSSGDVLGFTISYTNVGNATAKKILMTTNISGTDSIGTDSSLADLLPGESASFAVTGKVLTDYSKGTSLCLSGFITGGNETASFSNNILSGACYTFGSLPDIETHAVLQSDLDSAASGDILTYTIYLTATGLDFTEPVAHISLNTTLSANLQLISSGNRTDISLDPGQTRTFNIQARIVSFPAQGSNIMLTGSALYAGREISKINNDFVLTGHLPGLSDIYVTHNQLPFNGFKQGDTVVYTIFYGNSGYRDAANVQLTTTLPSILQTATPSVSLGTLSAGQTGSLVVTGTLTAFLAAGTSFTSQVLVTTPTPQTTTGNDTSIRTGIVGTFNGFTFDLAAQNITRPSLTLNPQTTIQAVSGDTIQFTLTYANNGNVSGASAILSFSNIGHLILAPYTANLGNLAPGQQGTIIVNGVINGSNFADFSPAAMFSYNGSGISDSITIQEPYLCGDGLLTKNEPCDTNGQINAGSGQSCENQQGVCVLVTKFISNTACVEFNGNTVCSSPAIINLKEPSCGTLDVQTPNNEEVTARCFGKYTNAFTPISLNCGNGTIFTGLAGSVGMLAGTCSYSSHSAAQNAKISCAVGNDVNNNDCKRGTNSCTLKADTEVAIVSNDEDEGTIEFTCTTKNNQESMLQIDCGNGEKSDTEQDNKINYTCHYTQNDYDDLGKDKTLGARCLINSAEACTHDITLDKGFLGICGNGTREGYEQCDGGGKNGEGNRKGQLCQKGCVVSDTAGSCLSVNNANVSVQNKELLPFWRRILNTSNITTNTACNENTQNMIKRNSMKCSFTLKQPGKDPTNLFTVNCDDHQLGNYTLFQDFYPDYRKTAFGNYYVDLSTLLDSQSRGDTRFGEYKLRLDNVTYQYCSCDGNDCNREDTETRNVCETNFVVTRPYLIQKSVFGTSPKATDARLTDFYDINGNALISRTDLNQVTVLNSSDYAGGTQVSTMMKEFAAKTETLSVKITKGIPASLSAAGVTVKKVPNKDIFILEGGAGSAITLKEFAAFTKPFTIIIKNSNLIIKGPIQVNGMFVVLNGTIFFNESETARCVGPQVVKGIFVAKNFNAEKISNISSSPSRCNNGSLHVQGVLIGNGIDTLVHNRRSNLTQWFHVNGSERTQQTARRNQIFNGAAVLIEYSPALWQQLPPGAEEFTKGLDIYKK